METQQNKLLFAVNTWLDDIYCSTESLSSSKLTRLFDLIKELDQNTVKERLNKQVDLAALSLKNDPVFAKRVLWWISTCLVAELYEHLKAKQVSLLELISLPEYLFLPYMARKNSKVKAIGRVGKLGMEICEFLGPYSFLNEPLVLETLNDYANSQTVDTKAKAVPLTGEYLDWLAILGEAIVRVPFTLQYVNPLTEEGVPYFIQPESPIHTVQALFSSLIVEYLQQPMIKLR